jgi:hypothetical protein
VSLEDATELGGPTGAKRSDYTATETRTLAADFAAELQQSTEAGLREERQADVGLTGDGETSVKTADLVVATDLIDSTGAGSGISELGVRLNADNDSADAHCDSLT